MAYKFFQVSVRCADLVAAELNSFLKSHQALSVDRRWVDLGADSYGSICIEYRDGQASGRAEARGKSPAKD